MIYFTVEDDLEKIGELYKGWTGKDIKIISPLINSFFGVAKLEKTNGIVGAAQLIVIDDPFWNRSWGLVENVYVKEEYRDKGVAKQLMKYIEDLAFCLGCNYIKLTSSFGKIEGHKLYKSLGYIEGSSFKKVCE